MAKPEKDASVFAHIEALVAEEHRLFEHGELNDAQQKRLGEVRIELDRYWDLLRQPNGEQWVVITTVVEDPPYLQRPYIVSSHFKKETDGSKWDPSPCTAIW